MEPFKEHVTASALLLVWCRGVSGPESRVVIIFLHRLALMVIFCAAQEAYGWLLREAAAYM